MGFRACLGFQGFPICCTHVGSWWLICSKSGGVPTVTRHFVRHAGKTFLWARFLSLEIANGSGFNIACPRSILEKKMDNKKAK